MCEAAQLLSLDVLRRFSQETEKTADFRRNLHAANRRLAFVPLVLSPQAQPSKKQGNPQKQGFCRCGTLKIIGKVRAGCWQNDTPNFTTPLHGGEKWFWARLR